MSDPFAIPERCTAEIDDITRRAAERLGHPRAPGTKGGVLLVLEVLRRMRHSPWCPAEKERVAANWERACTCGWCCCCEVSDVVRIVNLAS